jgi:transposase
MAETRRKFDADFRDGAVGLVRETGKPIAQVARDLGINEGTLGNGVNADKRRREDGSGALDEDERAELARLRRRTPSRGGRMRHPQRCSRPTPDDQRSPRNRPRQRRHHRRKPESKHPLAEDRGAPDRPDLHASADERQGPASRAERRGRRAFSWTCSITEHFLRMSG